MRPARMRARILFSSDGPRPPHCGGSPPVRVAAYFTSPPPLPAGFVVFPLVWIFVYMYLRHLWRYTHWIHILTHIWMLYYYVSLSLRENILKTNGSNIKTWWIIHHYLSSVMSITVLTCECTHAPGVVR